MGTLTVEKRYSFWRIKTVGFGRRVTCPEVSDAPQPAPDAVHDRQQVEVANNGGYQVEYGRVDAERADAGGRQQDADGLAAERGEVQERWPVVVPVLVLDLPLLVLQMQDGPTLRVIQRRRPVARAQQERGEHRGGDQLQAKPPADCAVK